MKNIYSTPHAELSILCKEDIMTTSSASRLNPVGEGLGQEVDFGDFIK